MTRRRVAGEAGHRPVTDLAMDLPMSRPAVSQHLKLLLDARLVDVRQQGRQRIYAARPDGLAALREELDTFWRQALSNFQRIAEESTKEQP